MASFPTRLVPCRFIATDSLLIRAMRIMGGRGMHSPIPNGVEKHWPCEDPVLRHVLSTRERGAPFHVDVGPIGAAARKFHASC